MTTKLAEAICAVLPVTKTRKEIAGEWLSAWERAAGPAAALSLATAESRLSELTNGKASGRRFFFSSTNEARGLTLLRVFHVSEDNITQILGIARQELGPPAPFRLVVNVTPGPQDASALASMFEGLRGLFCGPRAVRPMTWLMTPAQYDGLPRSFDELRNDVAFERVVPEQARVRARELGDAGALIASPVVCGPPELWAALRLGARPALAPEDALAQFEEKGELGWPAIVRPLVRIAKPAPNAKLVEPDPLTRWTIAKRLADGTPLLRVDGQRLLLDADSSDYLASRAVEVGRDERLAWADQLGVEASATEWEWKVGLPHRLAPMVLLTSYSPSEPLRVEDLLRTAELEHRPVALRVDDTMHLVNPTEGAENELLGERVRVHRVAPSRRPNVESFFGRAARLGAVDLLADPYLDALAREHVSGETDRWAIARAHAALCLQQRVSSQAAVPVREWRAPLEQLLAKATALTARCRLRGLWKKTDYESRQLDQTVAPLSGFIRRGPLPSNGEPWLPPVCSVEIGRDEEYWVVWSESRGGEGRNSATSQSRRELRLPRLVDDVDAWGENLCRTLVDETEQRSATAEHTVTASLPAQTAARLELTGWFTHDRQLALASDALRRALLLEPGIPLPGGAVLVPVARGIVAEITVVADPHVEGAGVVGGVDVAFELPELRAGNERVLAVAEGTVRLESGEGRHADVPRGIWLRGQGARVQVGFRGSVFHG